MQHETRPIEGHWETDVRADSLIPSDVIRWKECRHLGRCTRTRCANDWHVAVVVEGSSSNIGYDSVRFAFVPVTVPGGNLIHRGRHDVCTSPDNRQYDRFVSDEA